MGFKNYGLMAAKMDRRWAVLNILWIHGVCVEQGEDSVGF